MSTVDEIIATGQYRDRRGREWTKCPVHPIELNDCWWTYGKPVPRDFEHKPESAMRLLIERDQHQCGYLFAAECDDHPVPVVCRRVGGTDWIISGELGGYSTLPEAMNAARALAVSE